MAGKFYKLIHHTSLIKQQHEDDEFIRLTLLIALQALLTTYMGIMLFFFSRINVYILPLVNRKATTVDHFLANPLLAILTSFLLSFLIIILIEARNPIFKERSVLEEYHYIKSSFVVGLEYEYENESDQTLEKVIASQLKRDILFVYLNGILAGLYSVLYYFIITYTTFIFFLMVNINFFSPSVTAMLSGLMTTGLTVMRLSIVKTKLKEKDIPPYNPHAEYETSKRQIEILDSNMPPIICPACRSYIAATSKNCRVCGEDLTLNVE